MRGGRGLAAGRDSELGPGLWDERHTRGVRQGGALLPLDTGDDAPGLRQSLPFHLLPLKNI